MTVSAFMANKKTLRLEGLERNGLASRSAQATLPPRSWRQGQPQVRTVTEVIAEQGKRTWDRRQGVRYVRWVSARRGFPSALADSARSGSSRRRQVSPRPKPILLQA